MPPAGEDELIERYFAHLALRGFAQATFRSEEGNLKHFRRHADVSLAKALHEVTPGDLESYVSHLGRYLSSVTVVARLTTLRRFYAFLKKEGVILQNPFDRAEIPGKPGYRPRHVPDEREIRALFERLDPHTYCGIRDRAIIEMLYSTGLRSKELRFLRVKDVDFGARSVTVLHGKFQRQRIVPIGESALTALRLYLEVSRPHFLRKQRPWFTKKLPDDTLFLSEWGNPLEPSAVYTILRRYTMYSPATRRITAHGLRHAFATHLLQNGAPIEAVQRLLGHKLMTSTQIYTHPTIEDLKKIHQRCHPREQKIGSKKPIETVS